VTSPTLTALNAPGTKPGDKVVTLSNTSNTSTQEIGIASAGNLARAPLTRKDSSSQVAQPSSAILTALPASVASASMSTFALASFSVNDTLDGSKDLAARLAATSHAASAIDDDESMMLTARFPPMALLGTRPAQLPPISNQKKMAGLTVNTNVSSASSSSIVSAASSSPKSAKGTDAMDLSASLADESFVFPEQPVEPDGQALLTAAAMPSAAAMLMGPVSNGEPGDMSAGHSAARGRSQSVDAGNQGGAKMSYGSNALSSIDPASALAAWSSSVEAASHKDGNSNRSRPQSRTSQSSVSGAASSPAVAAAVVSDSDAPLPPLELMSTTSPLIRPSSGRSTLSTASGASISVSAVRASPHLSVQTSYHLSSYHQRQLNRNLAPGVPRSCTLARLASALSTLVTDWEIVAQDFVNRQRQKLPTMGRLAPPPRPRLPQPSQTKAASPPLQALTSPIRPSTLSMPPSAASTSSAAAASSSSSSSSSPSPPPSDSGWESAVETRALELLATLSSDRRAQLLQRVMAAQSDAQL
jgi:hypothetical protein